MDYRKNGKPDVHYYSNRLNNKLNYLRTSLAAVIEAPSGYGKTTAVQDYLGKNLSQSTDVYWFTAADEAPEAGYLRLCREIEKIDSQVGECLLRIGFPNVFTIGECCDALRDIECDRDSWLVIDNFQSLNTSLPASFLTALLEHGGSGLHIVIITQMLGRDVHSSIAGRAFLHITAADLRLDTDDILRYYALSGVVITRKEAQSAAHYTEGWIVALFLQLKAYQETGHFSKAAIISLMDHVVWERLTEQQKTFLLQLSPFEMITVQQVCVLAQYDSMPGYALEALQSPFIRYDGSRSQYELHSILSELLVQKLRERGEAFERECFIRAGNLCRDNNRNAEALAFYWKIKDYKGILSMDFTYLIFDKTGGVPFSAIALDLVQNCPTKIRNEYPLSMLRIAWALKATGMDAMFTNLLDELDLTLGQDAFLRAEWHLLSAYRFFPGIDKMIPLLKEATLLFKGKSSRVILPDAPWCFGDYSQMVTFHLKQGEADREADTLEEFIALYSKLTNGHGSGADALFRAELAHYRGDLKQAEVLAYKAIFLAEANRQSIVHLGAAMHLCEIAVEKSSFKEWQSALDSMEHAASYQSNDAVRVVLDTQRGLLLNELGYPERIPDWLKNMDQIKQLPPALRYNALYVHVTFLMHTGEFVRMIGILQAVRESINPYPKFGSILIYIMIAIGHIQTGDRVSGAENLKQALEEGMPDDLTYIFAAHHWLLKQLSEELIRKNFPEHLTRYKEIKDRFKIGFDRLHTALLHGSLPENLTEREREIALLAAKGLKNSEIAAELIITENTVRTHLHSVFQKLDIDRRAKLAEKLLKN
jgi:LuxR family maltose regulon positive regulatory protein